MAQLITIKEQSEIEGEGGWRAVVRFNNGAEHHITVSDPFSGEAEKELAWYFEEHLEFPFTKKVRAQQAAHSIFTCGEKLFNQVFLQNDDARFEYRTARQAGLNDAQIEIEGTPKFHALHWEALKDPAMPDPLVLQATMIRKNLVPSAIQSQIRPSPTINLLVVVARPSGTRDVGYRTISRPLVEALRQTNIPIRIEILRPGTYRSLENHLRETTARHGEGYYHVVHFDVHGAVLSHAQLQKGRQANRIVYNQRYGRSDLQPYDGVKAFLSFESEQADGKSDLVEASELANLLLTHHVPITILNSCQSGMPTSDGEREPETSLGSRLMQAGVQLVLAMGYSVTVSAAELLMRTLYQKLFENDDLTIAIRHARAELYNHKERTAYFDQRIDLEDWLLPVVYENQSVTLHPRDFTFQERAVWFEEKAEEKTYIPPEPTYGFVGRDLDILQIEKRLLTKRNLLLVRGMGGAGKTTLLRHLGGWWHTTGFVQRVFYFGYDTRAWTLQQIMTEIAQQLYGPKYYTDFQPLSLKAQQSMLANDLRAAPHLLILDNLESITGAHLAIQHTLPKEEQAALHSFLVDLAKGKTRVLLGSRSGEDWLAKSTFDDNLYDLPGLDAEAASLLADRILEKCNATRYRSDEQEHENLRRLIKLLDGFPLAMEVVLANLAKQTPQEILDALQAGDVKIDPKSDNQERTTSILRCIDYSHSNLSPEAQQLLLCLAPFTSVVCIEDSILNDYINKLRQQPALANLPFDRWLEVLHEAQNWGLLSLHEVPGYMHMQPTLAYFLRNRLNETGQAVVREAIETAFREHYDAVGGTLYQLLNSKEPQNRGIGRLLVSLEYENLVAALNLALAVQVSIAGPYNVLFEYFDATRNQRRGLGLFQTTLERFERYPTEKLTESLIIEIASLLGTIANWQRDLRQLSAAEASYQKLLMLLQSMVNLDDKKRNDLRARTYHNLGTVAQLQRQWELAEHYHQQALHLRIELNDNRLSQALIYSDLGVAAGEQQQWQQATQYFQQALQIFIEYNARYEQAKIHYELGTVARKQQQWQQATQYFQQALQIFIEYNARYEQARIYYQLGMMAWEQRQWQQAEQYYQKALQLEIEYNDRYSQASAYWGLGAVAQEQQQWQQAGEYYLQVLQILAEYEDNYRANIALRNLARLWVASNDDNVRANISKAFGKNVDETEKLLLKALEEQEEAQTDDVEKKE